MKPLSTYYDSAVTAWLLAFPGRIVTPFKLSELSGTAFIRAATTTTAINGLKTGICPLYPFSQMMTFYLQR
jgi:hypothetical protein